MINEKVMVENVEATQKQWAHLHNRIRVGKKMGVLTDEEISKFNDIYRMYLNTFDTINYNNYPEVISFYVNDTKKYESLINEINKRLEDDLV